MGEFVELCYVELSIPTLDERFSQRFPRYCKPWPVWVLRIATEVLAVRFPTIQKIKIFETLLALHYIALEFRLDGTNWDDRPPWSGVDEKFVGAMAGHFLAHFLRWEFLTQDPQEKNSRALVVAAPQGKRPSLEDFEKRFVPILADHFKKFPAAFLDFQSAFAEAKDVTFDQFGFKKETPLAPIYLKILADWTEIECLSGPTALTEYLSPMLGNQEFEKKYERVKKLCQRMGITFPPVVKGQ
jgi:hypothetical protein